MPMPCIIESFITRFFKKGEEVIPLTRSSEQRSERDNFLASPLPFFMGVIFFLGFRLAPTGYKSF